VTDSRREQVLVTERAEDRGPGEERSGGFKEVAPLLRVSMLVYEDTRSSVIFEAVLDQALWQKL
jgi:hypothetical protein